MTEKKIAVEDLRQMLNVERFTPLANNVMYNLDCNACLFK